MDATRLGHIQVARLVHRDTLHAFNLTGKRSLGHSVGLVFHIKELDGQVGVQVNDSTVVHEVVEILLFEVGLTLHDQVLGEHVRRIGALEHRVLTVRLQVPRDNVEAQVGIVDDEELDKILDTGGEDVLNPNLGTGGDLEVDGIVSEAVMDRRLSADELDFGARLGDHVVVEEPSTLNLAVSALETCQSVNATVTQVHSLLLCGDLAFKDNPLVVARGSIELDSVALRRLRVFILDGIAEPAPVLLDVLLDVRVLGKVVLHNNFHHADITHRGTVLNTALGEQALVVDCLGGTQLDIILDEGEELGIDRLELPDMLTSKSLVGGKSETVENGSFLAARRILFSLFLGFLGCLDGVKGGGSDHASEATKLSFSFNFLLSCLCCLFLFFLLVFLFLGEEARSLEDEVLATFAHIDKLDLVAAEALTASMELDLTQELADQREDQVAA